MNDKLRRIGVISNLVPLLVACRTRTDIGRERFGEILRLAELFAFRSSVVGTRADAGQGTLFPLANRVIARKATSNEVLTTLREVTNKYGSSVDFRFALSRTENWYGWKLLRYLLFEYELHLTGKSHKPALPWQEVEGGKLERTIEHILPQTPSDPYWKDRFTALDIESLTNDLGNLCLTYDNSSYKNKSFPEKKGSYDQVTPCYARSPLYQERDLCKLDEWTPETIRSRREEIFSFIFERWQVRVPSTSSSTEPASG